jgi:hypothetical protein
MRPAEIPVTPAGDAKSQIRDEDGDGFTPTKTRSGRGGG